MREDTEVQVTAGGMRRYRSGYGVEARDRRMFLWRVAGKVGGFRLASWSYYTISRQWDISESRANQAVKKYGRRIGLPWHWDDPDDGVSPERLRRIVKVMLAEDRV